MQPKDWFTVLALAISIAGLGLALCNFKLSSRIKILELRSTLTAKVVEFIIRLDRLDRSLDALRLEAKLQDDQQAADDVPSTGSLRADIQHLYTSVSTMPLQKIVTLYEAIYATLLKNSEQLSDLDVQAKEWQAKYVRLVAKRAELKVSRDDA